MDLIDARMIAIMFKVKPGTVYSWKCRGQLPDPLIQVGNKPLWERSQLKTWKPPQGNKSQAAEPVLDSDESVTICDSTSDSEVNDSWWDS